MWRIRGVAFLSIIVGCGAAQPTRAAAPRPASWQLTIAQRFVERTSVALRLSPARDVVTSSARVRLLRTARAPASHTLTLRPPRVCGAFDGALSQLRVESSTGALIRAEIRDGAVVLHPVGDGAADIDVQGEYVHGATGCDDGLAAGARVPLRARLRVEASSVAGRASIGGSGRCSANGGAFAGARSPVALSAALLDAANDPVSFANVHPLAPFEIRVDSELPVSVTSDGLLALPDRSGVLRMAVAGQRGQWLWRWRVPPAEVTDATVRFFVGGSAGAPAEVTDGARIAGSHRKVGAVFFQLLAAVVGDAPLCDAPDPRWFELRSDTPDVCVPVAVTSASCDECSAQGIGTQAARILRDGECSIRLEAPSTNHGRGLRRRVSAVFENVANFAGGAPDAAPP